MSSSSILATKILLISSCVVWLAIIMKSTIIPWLINFSMSELPMIWSFLVSLCKPPYLYVVINGIIITIAASSRFTRTQTESNFENYEPLITVRTPPRIETQHDLFEGANVVEELVLLNLENKVGGKGEEEVQENRVELVHQEPEVVHQKPEVVHQEPEVVHQKPEVVLAVRRKNRSLSRFGPPKASNATPLGKKEVIVEEAEDSSDREEVTLESMWKMIMEGREEPFLLEDYTQKVDDENSLNKPSASTPPTSQLCNPKSFKGGATYLSDSPIKSWILKKEPSLGQDELNRRAEAFIQNFNEEMRMQRQQSLMQNMIKSTGNNYSS